MYAELSKAQEGIELPLPDYLKQASEFFRDLAQSDGTILLRDIKERHNTFDLFKLTSGQLSKAIWDVRDYMIVDVMKKTSGRNSGEHYLNRDDFLAFAVFIRCYIRFATQGTGSKFPSDLNVDLSKVILAAKNELANTSLADCIHDQALVSGDTKIGRKVSIMLDLADKGETDLSDWSREKVDSEFSRIFSSTDRFSVSQYPNIPIDVIKKVMGIAYASGRELVRFDPELSDLTCLEAHNAGRILLGYFRRYPQYKDLGQLWEAVKEAIKKDRESYYSKSNARTS